MVLDITIILVFLISTLRGKAKGLGETVIRLLALVLSVFLGVQLTEPLAAILRLTPIDEILIDNLIKAADAESINIADLLPGRLGTLAALLGGGASVEIAKCAEMLITVLAFVIIVFAVWAVATFLRRKLRKSRKSGGLVGTVDSAAGLLYGALRGAVLVMLLLAFMLPFAGVFMPDKIAVLNEQLNNSFIAGYLYDLNPLLRFIRHIG